MPDKKLVVVGDGNMRKAWESAKRSPNIKFTGWVDHDEVVKICSRAKAFLFAAEEDFGIAPVEAQALGMSVIAYGKGGTEETVVPVNGPAKAANPTGLFFYEQSAEALMEAVNKFEKIEGEFDPLDARHNAERFSEGNFKKNIKEFVGLKMGKVAV